jgi:hypothetical protein
VISFVFHISNVIFANRGQINTVASKSKKDRQSEDKGSPSEEIKQDNVEAARTTIEK